MQSTFDIKKIINEEKIKTIYLQFVDINGKIKSVNIPSEQIDSILDGRIVFDGSSLGGNRINETLDLRIIPDLTTFLIIPTDRKNNKSIARFICDIHNSDGTPFNGCPRSNLKKIIAKARENGYKLQIGPEIEFFLFKTDKNDTVIELEAEQTGYYDTSSTNKYDETLLEMLETLENIGFNVEAFHHEGAPYQHEIDLGYDDALKTADNLITFKFLIKTIAKQYGYKASFMPKPMINHNGSGLHLNLSITDTEGKNLFYNPITKYELSKEAMYSIGSILKEIKGITAILNPTINSFKRLVKDYEAPIYIVWSVITRSALIRIPATRGNETRIELRSPDFGCNPYLAFAVILQTCLDGIRNKTDAPQPMEKNLFQMSNNEIKQRKIKSLPRNMFTALQEFEKSLVAKAALGEYLYSEFLECKRIEWNNYRKQVTPWELENYIDI